MAGLHLGKVKNVVDQLEETAAGPPKNTEILALIWSQLSVPQQIGHPDNRVHRRADLMADRGQELSFGFAGDFGRFLGDDQSLLCGGMLHRFPSACGTFLTQRALGLSQCTGKRLSGKLNPGWRVTLRHG